jgi:hypothetical protein
MHLEGLEPAIPAKDTGIFATGGSGIHNPSKGARYLCIWRDWNPQSQRKETGIFAAGGTGTRNPSKGARYLCIWRDWNPQSQQRRQASLHLERLEPAIPAKETGIHAPGGIGIRNPSKGAAADSLLKPRGHCVCLQLLLIIIIGIVVPLFPFI